MPARNARENFQARSQRREVPDQVQQLCVSVDRDRIGIAALLKQCGLAASTSEASRLMKGGGVRLNAEKVLDAAASVPVPSSNLFQVGKRAFAQIELKRE